MLFVEMVIDMNESRFEKARGSKKGREKGKEKKATFNPKKSKVHVYPSIEKATSQGQYGEVFSTDTADRLYVVTKPTWGKKSREGGNTKVAKGFTPGSSTPGSSFNSIKGYAKRTRKKHGGARTNEELDELDISRLAQARMNAHGTKKDKLKGVVGKAKRKKVAKGHSDFVRAEVEDQQERERDDRDRSAY